MRRNEEQWAKSHSQRTHIKLRDKLNESPVETENRQAQVDEEFNVFLKGIDELTLATCGQENRSEERRRERENGCRRLLDRDVGGGLVFVRIRIWQGNEELARGHRRGWPQGSHRVLGGDPEPCIKR